MALIVASLDKRIHDRTAFECGQPALDEYLRSRAAKHQSQRISRTFVLTDESAPSRILGFYTLSNAQLAREQLTQADAHALPRHPVPAIRLARLAVARAEQGQRFGQWLLMDALKRCALVGDHSGVFALIVDAKDHEAVSYYQRFGFRPIADHPLSLYLPLATALNALRVVLSDGGSSRTASERI